MLAARGIYYFRLLVGAAAVLGGIVVLAASGDNESLGLAVLLWGVFILGHLGIETLYQRVRGQYDSVGQQLQPTSGLREFAIAFPSTSGVILGLVAVFGSEDFSLTTKVGIGALVADILVGLVLVGLVIAAPDSGDQRSWNLIRYVFNLALWALALGLLCIGIALLNL
ncbi:MAG TPA: hypothetical protein VN458_07220 [Solirubrobacterales bacterium]|nr:hypothetical protein [Solirubrobacterales bacterium]